MFPTYLNKKVAVSYLATVNLLSFIYYAACGKHYCTVKRNEIEANKSHIGSITLKSLI